MVRNEIGGNQFSTKNIGGKKQRLEAPVKTIILAKDNQSFTKEEFKNVIVNWKKEIKNKNLVPFPNAEGLEPNNTEAQLKEGRYEDYELKSAVSGTKYRFDISNTTYESFLTYKNSQYTRIYEITNLDEVLCDIQPNGEIKGRKISSFIIGNRNQATDSDVPFVDVSIKYENNTHSILKTDGEPSDLEGIYDALFEKVAYSTNSIKFRLKNVFTEDYITQVLYSDFVIKDKNGAIVGSLGNIPVDNTGVYEITGTFSNGYSLELNGVVDLTELLIEPVNTLSIQIP